MNMKCKHDVCNVCERISRGGCLVPENQSLCRFFEPLSVKELVDEIERLEKRVKELECRRTTYPYYPWTQVYPYWTNGTGTTSDCGTQWTYTTNSI